MSLRRSYCAGVLVLSALLGACSSGEDASASGEASATEQASSTTRVPRATDQSDRPQVPFDPCLDIPDETLVEAGFDPATEEMDEFSADYYTFLSCAYNTAQRQYGLNILSGNITFAEEQEKAKDYATPIEINGRRALLERDPAEMVSCAVSIETGYGILIVSRLIQRTRSDHNPTPKELCNGIEDLAGLFERHLPEGV